MSELGLYTYCGDEQMDTSSEAVDEKPLEWMKGVPQVILTLPASTELTSTANIPAGNSESARDTGAQLIETSIHSTEPASESVATDENRALSERPVALHESTAHTLQEEGVQQLDPELVRSVDTLAIATEESLSRQSATDQPENAESVKSAGGENEEEKKEDTMRSLSECGTPPSPIVSEFEPDDGDARSSRAALSQENVDALFSARARIRSAIAQNRAFEHIFQEVDEDANSYVSSSTVP